MLRQDLTYGFRALRKKPGFTVIAILVLALGIGANTAIFSVVYSVLLRSLPFKDPDHLVMVFSRNTRQNMDYSTISADDLADFQQQNDVFEGLSGLTGQWTFTLSTSNGAEQIFGAWVGSNFFDIVGIHPAMGRSFTADEDRSNGPGVVVISYELWQRRFGGDPQVLSRSLVVDGNTNQIIGVMPRAFQFLDSGDVWFPLQKNPIVSRGRNVRFLNSIARLKKNVSVTQAEAAIQTIAGRLEQSYPATNTGFGTEIQGLQEHVTGNVRPTLLILLASVGFVLLIACANVANLMLVRASDRRREVAVRTALGADRRRLVRQFLTESVLLSVLGSAAGIVLAEWGIRIMIGLGPNLPRLTEIGIDLPVLAFTFGLSILTGLAFGLVPALLGTRENLNDTLKESGRSEVSGSASHRLRSILVVSEVALALVLLVGSGLLIRSFLRLMDIDPGYRTDHMVVVSAAVPPVKYPQPQQRLDLYYSLEARLKSIPGVTSVGAVSRFPLSSVLGASNVTSFFTIEGKPVATGNRPQIDYRIASEDYFDAMGIPLIRGRKFTRQDTTAVAIVNDAAAKAFWPGEDPVGKRVNFGADVTQSPWVMIVAVVGNVRHLGLEIEPRPEIYRPYGNNPLTGPMIAVHTAGDPHSIMPVVQSEMRSVESDMPLVINTIDHLIELSVAQRRFAMLLIGVFAGLAMVLAIVGIYGVMSTIVSQRTHEIGLRIALGAEARQVYSLIVREGLTLTAIGVAIGLIVSAAVTRGMSSLLFGIKASDPLTYVAVSATLIAVALVACYIPARRASRVDPLVALRHE